MGDTEITSAQEAANDTRVLAFGRLLGAANRLEHIVGKALEEECGINHLTFEVLLILGRAGTSGLSMSAIAREQVLTTGGATRLVRRMMTAGLVEHADNPADARVQMVRLTGLGERTAVAASRVHVRNVQRLFLDPVPVDHRERFAEDLRLLSHTARDALPPLR